MLLRVSTPPHRDLPIEWRTETGDVIGQSPGGAAQPAEPPHSAEDPLELTVDAEDRRLAVRVRVAAVVVAVLAVGVTWALGGLKTAPADPDDGIRTVAVGEAVNTGQFLLIVERAAVFTEFGTARPTEPGGRLLVVALTAEVTVDQTRSVSRAVSLSGVDGLAEDEPMRILLMRDGGLAFYLQPALPERIAYVWELAPEAGVPDEVDVLLNFASYRKSVFPGQGRLWFDDGPGARVTVAVDDRTEAA